MEADRNPNRGPETALVTGASGFIGGHLAAHLVERGDRPRCLVRPSSRVSRLRGLGAELVRSDLAGDGDLAPALAGVDVVYHLAGVTKARHTSDYARGNVRATARLLRAARAARERGQAGLRRLVLVSSLAAAGPSPGGSPLAEDAEPSPVSRYGRSKLLAERVAREVGRGVPVTIVRPPVVYGPRDTDFFQLIRAAARGWVAEVGDGGGRAYSLIHVRDLVRGMVVAGESPRAAGQTYYLTGEPPCPWRGLLALLAGLLGRPVRPVSVPGPLAWCVGAASELVCAFAGRPALLSRDKVREAREGSWTCDGAKAARELGFQATISLAEGLRETIAWYRGEGWL
jgi:nucleoside-diphosphate-sugar epimerase